MPELAEDQKTMAQLVAAGVSPLKAAAQVGMTPSAARVVMRSPLFNALVEKHRAEILGPLIERTKKMLEEAVPDAVQTIIELSKTARQEAVRFNAAKAVLDWTKAVPKDEKLEAGLTIIIEGEAAANLRQLGAMLPAIDIVPTATEVILQLPNREDGGSA